MLDVGWGIRTLPTGEVRRRDVHRPRLPEDHEVGMNVSERSLRMEDLHPSLRGVRCAHLSDVHLGWSTPCSQIRSAVAAVNRAGVDFTVITGDFFALPSRPAAQSLEALAGIRGPVFAVLGNHDRGKRAVAVDRAMHSCGYVLLLDEVKEICIGGNRLSIVGLDGSHGNRKLVEHILSSISPDRAVVVLSHNPAGFRMIPEGRGWLCLSGHTHGGHFVVPGVTAKLFQLFGQIWMAGEFRMSGNVLHVSRGVGCSRRLAGRAGASAELPILTVSSGAATPGGGPTATTPAERRQLPRTLLRQARRLLDSNQVGLRGFARGVLRNRRHDHSQKMALLIKRSRRMGGPGRNPQD